MAFLQFAFNLLVATLLILEPLTIAAPCKDCFTQSRAAYYLNSDDKGTESKLISSPKLQKMTCMITANDFIDIYSAKS